MVIMVGGMTCLYTTRLEWMTGGVDAFDGGHLLSVVKSSFTKPPDCQAKLHRGREALKALVSSQSAWRNG